MIDTTKMKYADFERLCQEIEMKAKNFEENNFSRNKFFLSLSNGERLKIIFTKSSVAHLLGVNTEYLKSSRTVKSNISYDILLELTTEAYSISRKVDSGILNYSSFISNYIDEKLEIFEENISINWDSIEFICKFDKSRCHEFDGQVDIDYFIGRKIDEYTLLLLGVKKSNDMYYPVTSQLIDEISERGKNVLNKYLSNQVLLLPNSLKIDDGIGFYKRGKVLHDKNDKEIQDKLHNLYELAVQYNCTIDVSDMLDFQLTKINGVYEALTKMTYCLENGTKIDTSELGKVPHQILGLVSRLNNLTNLTPDKSAELIKVLQEEVKTLTMKNTELQISNEELSSSNQVLQEENGILQAKNNELANTIAGVRKLVI